MTTMIIGIGTDIIRIDRIAQGIERWGDSYLRKMFTQHEIDYASSKANTAAVYAKRFAAKEAFFKALGTGFAEGMAWHDVEVTNDDLGKPSFNLSGQARKTMLSLSGDAKAHLTLADTSDDAMAFVVIEG